MLVHVLDIACCATRCLSASRLRRGQPMPSIYTCRWRGGGRPVSQCGVRARSAPRRGVEALCCAVSIVGDREMRTQIPLGQLHSKRPKHTCAWLARGRLALRCTTCSQPSPLKHAAANTDDDAAASATSADPNRAAGASARQADAFKRQAHARVLSRTADHPNRGHAKQEASWQAAVMLLQAQDALHETSVWTRELFTPADADAAASSGAYCRRERGWRRP